MPSELLRGLNPPQQAAASHVSGPALVLAGAGSGKTRVITRRIAWLIAAGHAAPENILAVTFTNKAATEMRERVAKLTGRAAARKLTISTFHSFCLQVLRTHIETIGYRRNFTISGESDARTLLRRVVEDMPDRESFDLGAFQGLISLCKNTGGKPDAPRAVRNPQQQKYHDALEEVYAKYQSAMRAANSLDFDDLLSVTLELWQSQPHVLTHYQERFRYVMVDEYQDTNAVQLGLLRTLVQSHQNLFVVGDDDQAIYGWRGADFRNILEFEKHFPQARIITLDQNYRSTTSILDAANHIIANNSSRREKRLWSDLGQGKPIDLLIVGDEEEEARHAVRWLQAIQQQTGARYSDFAILYRSNLQSKAFEMALQQAGIPYAVYGGQEFFERTEVRDVICYLKTLANPRDEAAFLRIANMPRRGIGDTTLHKAHEICQRERVSLGKALALLLEREACSAPAAHGIRELLGLLQHFRRRFRERKEPLAQLVFELTQAIDYRGELDRVSKSPQQASGRWQNVEIVLRALQEYEEEAEEPTLAGFLDATHLSSDRERGSREARRQSGVSLMTVHSAKGLEFPFVFIVGLEEGLFPHSRSVEENGIEEERRLFYVALTRGKRHVTLFQTLSRSRFGKERMSKPSPFLRELPENLLRTQVLAVREMVEERVAPPEPKPKTRRPRKPRVS